MATKTQNRIDVKTPALAYVGVVDLAVEVVRDYVNELTKQFADFEPKDVRAQVNTRVEALSKDAQARRAAVEARVADLQAQGKELPAKATETYNGLAKRGDALVKRIRNQQSTKEAVKDAKTTVSKAKATKTTAQKTAAAKKTAAKQAVATRKAAGQRSAAATRSNAKGTVTAAKKTAEAAAKAVIDAAEKVGD